jgi:hypothetical protein
MGRDRYFAAGAAYLFDLISFLLRMVGRVGIEPTTN